MPGEDFQSWSTTAATNANADTSINWAEGQPRASVNNSARSMMAAHAKDRNLRNGSITTGGAANAQTFTSGISYTTVPTGLYVRLKIGFTNTGATTLNMDGIGAVAINDQAGLDLGPSALIVGQYAEFLYNGTNWILLSVSGASAAPFDAAAYNGMQINGAMDVSQERGSTPTGTNGAYICDGWQLLGNGTMAVSANANALPLGSIPGLSNSLAITVTTAQASLGTTDYVGILQSIEGWRVARLCWGNAAAQPITIGFWSAHHRTGVYGGVVRNFPTPSRTYAFNYTHNVADVAQYNTVTIPGCPDGAWNITNAVGLQVLFMMAGGANVIAPTANVWSTASYLTGPGQVNGVAATSDVFRITGVVVLPGTAAPSAARSALIMRPYPQELVMCQRYWYCSNPAAPKGASVGAIAFSAITTTLLAGSAKFGVTMRVTPTLTLWNNGVQNQVRRSTDGAVPVLTGLVAFMTQDNLALLGCTNTVLSPAGVSFDFDFQVDARF